VGRGKPQQLCEAVCSPRAAPARPPDADHGLTDRPVFLPAGSLQREHEDVKTEPPPNCSAGPNGDNLYEWAAVLHGPEATPYAGGVFFLAIHFPTDYPFKPPRIFFRTRIYHCNINSEGKVCLDVLTEGATWSPALTVSGLLTGITALLAEPNPHDPLVGSIAAQYITDRATHDATARDWTRRFAA
jgi:ubiquitin-conjugating enzyme E2 E